jgi:hypothetical protein
LRVVSVCPRAGAAFTARANLRDTRGFHVVYKGGSRERVAVARVQWHKAHKIEESA